MDTDSPRGPTIPAMTLQPIGVVHSAFTDQAGTPIQPALAGPDAVGTVEVYPQYGEALDDLEGFERIWLVCWLHRAGQVRLKVQPYLDDRERGLFATRAPSRPNPIGISAVRLVRREGLTLHVADLDVLDGTPLLDIKPYSARFDVFPEARQGWLRSAPGRRRSADDRFAPDS
jgi:tRNA-Thr(GGU) m(6)t(6)A37 methyltransferase TsaA